MDNPRPILLVVGGSRGIGAATCRMAAARGYDVALSYRSRRDRAEAVVTDVEAAGGRAIALAADVRDADQVQGLFARCRQQLGQPRAMVYSAGITGRAARLQDASPAVMQETLDVNVMGALLCCQQAIGAMAGVQGGGRIVLVSSGAATLGSPGEFVWYAASKGAIDTLTVGLSRELADEGIRVNAVSPGLTDTELHAESTGEPGRIERMAPSIPLGRAASAEEIAEPILWLLSDAASYVTGAVVRAAGGR